MHVKMQVRVIDAQKPQPLAPCADADHLVTYLRENCTPATPRLYSILPCLSQVPHAAFHFMRMHSLGCYKQKENAEIAPPQLTLAPSFLWGGEDNPYTRKRRQRDAAAHMLGSNRCTHVQLHLHIPADDKEPRSSLRHRCHRLAYLPAAQVPVARCPNTEHPPPPPPRILESYVVDSHSITLILQATDRSLILHQLV